MKQYPLTTLPALFHADEISDDGVYLKYPQTQEEAIEILHLLGLTVETQERRNDFRGEFSAVRSEFILHVREYLLHLQQGATWPYAAPRPTLPELGHPA